MSRPIHVIIEELDTDRDGSLLDESPVAEKLIARQEGGTAGTDDIEITHDGSKSSITSNSGDIELNFAADADGLRLNSADGTKNSTLAQLNNGTLLIGTETAGEIIAIRGDSAAQTYQVNFGADGLYPQQDNQVSLGTSSAGFTDLYLNGVAKLGIFTVATVPTASSYEGGAIYVSDGAAGSPILAYSNGTNWLRSDTGAAIASS